MIISLSADHAGFQYKELIKSIWLKRELKLLIGVLSQKIQLTIRIMFKNQPQMSLVVRKLWYRCCGSGIGVSISANKVKGIRAALVLNEEMASLSKKHNNANFLALSEKFIDKVNLFKIVDTWLSTEFEGGRHQRRIDKLEQN